MHVPSPPPPIRANDGEESARRGRIRGETQTTAGNRRLLLCCCCCCCQKPNKNKSAEITMPMRNNNSIDTLNTPTSTFRFASALFPIVFAVTAAAALLRRAAPEKLDIARTAGWEPRRPAKQRGAMHTHSHTIAIGHIYTCIHTHTHTHTHSLSLSPPKLLRRIGSTYY